MIRLFRRSGVYWIDQRAPGVRIRRSLDTRDAQQARAILRRLEDELLGTGRLQTPWTDFESELLAALDALVRPSTLRGYRYVLGRFGRFLAKRRIEYLAQVTPAMVVSFVEQRRFDQHPDWKRPITPGGIRFELRVLHRIFAYAAEVGYLSSNPVRQKNLNSEAGRTLPFTQSDVAAMLADPVLCGNLRHGVQLRAIVLTFLHTGLRISDVVHLEKSQLAGGTIVRRTIKRGRTVSLRIHPDLRQALDVHLALQSELGRRSPYVFTTERGRPIVGLDCILRRLFRRAGIDGGHAHRFRDTFAVRLLQHGASLYDVAKLMGISIQTADKHYTPYVKELQERGARLLDQLDFVTSAAS